MKILIINGPNLNMLGARDVNLYGALTLKQLNQKIEKYAKERYGVKCQFYFSNFEGDILELLQRTNADKVIINPGALSHYSYALRDCIECIKVDVVEVHLSNIYEREDLEKFASLKT